MKQKARFLASGTKQEVTNAYFYRISKNTSEMMLLHNHPTSLYSFYGAFLLEVGLYEQSLPILQVAREKAPHKLKILLREAQALEKLGRAEEANVIYKEVIRLVPEWEISRRIYQEFLDRQGVVK